MSKHLPINSSSFLAGIIIETLGADFEVFSNLSRYGVNLNELTIDLMRNTQAPQTPIRIAVSE